MTISRNELNTFFSKLLLPHEFTDYCPNGLQIEGTERINKIAFTLSASAKSIEQAVEMGADTLVTHHGIFWKYMETQTIRGPLAARIKPLIKNDVNLFAYHLPLDAHLEIGNAKCIANLLDMHKIAPFGDFKGSPTGIQGILRQPTKARVLAKNLKLLLGHNVVMASPNENNYIEKLGIITGGANDGWKQASRSGLDAFLTGEISEHDWHNSQEAGIHMFAGGHYATEKFGIQALMNKTQEQLDIPCFFIEQDNPV